MSRPTDAEVARSMQMHGVSFVQKLGQLFELADPQNQARIKVSWPEYWEQYAELHQLMKARAEAPK